MEKGNIEKLKNRLKETGYSKTDISFIQKAYETACSIHEKQLYNNEARLSAQCLHLLSTADILVELHLDANTIAASLMHDLLYTCDIDSKYLKQEFQGLFQYLEGMNMFHTMTMKYLKEELTQGTQDLLKRPIDNHVILISAAKRIDRLKEFAHVIEEERPYYLDNTNDILIKIVEKEGAFYLSEQLSEWWLRCKEDDPNDYKNYYEKYMKLLENNKPSTDETIAFLRAVFTGQAENMSLDMKNHTEQIEEVISSERLISNILKHIKKDERKGTIQPFSKWSVPLYDILLIFNDAVESTRFLIDEFIYIFQNYLRKHCFSIKNYLITNDRVPCFVIADRWENRYRVILRTRLLFRRYQIGAVADEEYNTQSSPNQFSDKGTVHIIIDNSNNGDTSDTSGNGYYPAGYCGLDYAFMIGKDSGLFFQKMVINNTVTDTIGNVKLNKGDTGKLYLSKDVIASFTWFNYLEVPQARERLIHHFEAYYKNKDNH